VQSPRRGGAGQQRGWQSLGGHRSSRAGRLWPGGAAAAHSIRLADPAAELIAALPNGAVISPMSGSVKGPVDPGPAWRVRAFVASHPMAGKSGGGGGAGPSGLCFRGAPGGHPVGRTDPEALRFGRGAGHACWPAEGVAGVRRARPRRGRGADFSHLPVLVSAALFCRLRRRDGCRCRGVWPPGAALPQRLC